MLLQVVGLYDHVINIHLNIPSYMISKNFIHKPLIGAPTFFNPKGHDLITIVGRIGYEGSLFTI